MDLDELLIREAVRDTIATYNARGDRGDVGGLAGCFAPDGVLAIVGRDPYVGPDAIRDGLANVPRTTAPDDGATPAIAYLHHCVTSLHFVSVDAEQVNTVSYFTALTPVGLDHWGRYRDRLVPVDGRWRFALRDVKVDGYAPMSLFAPAPDG